MATEVYENQGLGMPGNLQHTKHMVQTIHWFGLPEWNFILKLNQHPHDMHVWNEFIEANPTRSQQWFHSIHTYTDLYFLRGASRPLFKDPSSIEKNRAVLRVKAKDLASIGSKSPYLSDHEDDVKALGRQLFRLMGLRRFDSPFDRDGSLTFLYHPRMVNLPTFNIWSIFYGKCG